MLSIVIIKWSLDDNFLMSVVIEDIDICTVKEYRALVLKSVSQVDKSSILQVVKGCLVSLSE